MSKLIEALLLERKSYVLRKLPERVAAVDEQLAELGFSHKYLSPLEKSDIETASNEQIMETAIVRRGRKPKALDGDN